MYKWIRIRQDPVVRGRPPFPELADKVCLRLLLQK